MQHNVYVYIIIMALVTYLIRILPLTLMKKPINNRFLQSFLYYVPYVTLSVMTFPAILTATGNTLLGAVAMIVAVISAYAGASLPLTALVSCLIVYITSFFV